MGTRAEDFTKLPSLSNSKYLRASLKKERKSSEATTTKSGSRQKLRVRFVLPEQDVEQKTIRNKQFSALPLPAICEFVIFNDKPNRGVMERQGFSAVKKSPLGFSRTPAIAKDILKRHGSFANATNNYKVKGEDDFKTFQKKLTMGTAKDRKTTVSRRLSSTQTKKNYNFSTKELKIEERIKKPEDYSNPTYLDTKNRILEWLKYSHTFMPAYKRQAKRDQKYKC